MRRHSLISCILVLATVASVTPCAQAAPAVAEKSLEESLSGPALDAYDSAKLLFNNQDFANAQRKYERAYALSKDPRLLFDMAVCAKNLRAYARTETFLLRYKQEMGSRITPEDASIVEDALAAIKKLVGIVNLTVSEPGASVLLDDAEAGTTPLTVPLVLDLGVHVVLVKKSGFLDVANKVEVEGGTTTTLNVVLQPYVSAGHLVVSADAGAYIVVDGKVNAIGRFDAKVTAGPHTVRVTAAHKKPYEASVDLRDGETRTLQVTLPDEKQGGAVWPWIVGGAVVAAGAAVGGYFLFRPKDETTPVPNGKVDSVQFSLTGGAR